MLACAPDFATHALHGALRFRAATDGGGVTRILDISRTSPLQLQRPLHLDPTSGIATVHVVNATAGLFEGDALVVRADVGHRAALEMRTPAMTRVHTMSGAAGAVSRLELNVRDGGYLECLPQPLVLCAGAALRQETRVTLHAGAHLALGEVWAFGRVASGELHAYRRLDARTDVLRDGNLLLVEALSMCPADGSVGSSLGGHAVFGSLTLAGPCVDEGLLRRVRELLQARPGILAGASMLPCGAGLAVRILGDRAFAVHAPLVEIARAFRVRASMPAPRAHGGRSCQ